MRVDFGFALLVVGTLAACGAPDPHHQTWKPADVAALQEELASPTGTFDGEGFEAFRSDLEKVLGPFLDTQVLFDELVRVASDLADEPDAGTADAGPLRPAPAPPSERGTRFFLLLSCPGPDGDDVDFGHGSARIDTPTLKDLSSESLTESGDFLLTYDDCEGARVKASGASPGYYDVTRDALMLDYQATYEDRDTGLKVTYDGPLLYDRGSVHALLGPDEQSYRVSFQPRPSTTLEIAGATESIQCEMDPDALTITCP